MCSGLAHGAVYELEPSVAGANCVEEFEQIANRLKPGDTLVLRGGRYEQSCRRAVSIQGTEMQPIVIRAAANETPILTRPLHNQTTENNLELIDVRHLVISGIEFEGGSIGIRLLGNTHHFELSDSVIRNTGANAFAANVGNSTQLRLLRNTVSGTGKANGLTEGEGFYLGCHDRSCAVTNSLIEGNTLHNLASSSEGGNEGIELKPGSGGNTLRSNTIEGRELASDHPCILAYGGGQQPNIIENNLLTNCSVGIYVISNAVVRSNLIRSSSESAIAIHRHKSVGAPRKVSLINNTLVTGESGVGLRLSLWQATDIFVSNNAIFAPGEIGVTGWWLHRADFERNWVWGRLQGVPLRKVGITTRNKRLAPKLNEYVSDFVLAEFEDAGADSPLLGDSVDINGTPRVQGDAPDIGAFEQHQR